jgi:hypothetical protein
MNESNHLERQWLKELRLDQPVCWFCAPTLPLPKRAAVRYRTDIQP